MANITSTEPVKDSQRLEMAILGGMMTEPDILSYACASLSEDDFQSPDSRKLFSIIDDMREHEQHVDSIAVIDPCISGGVSQNYSDKCFSTYLDWKMNIDWDYDGITSLKDRIAELADLSDLRYAYSEAQAILKQMREKKLLDKVMISQRLQGLSSALLERHRLQGTDYIGDDAMKVLDRRVMARRGRIEFGLKPVDNYINGMGKGQLIIIAARPSVGKSAISLQPAIRTARNNNRVKIVTLEMTNDEVTERLLCMMSGVSSYAMTGEIPMTQTETVDLVKAMSELSRLPLSVDDVSFTPGQIEQAFLEAKNDGKPIRLMIIDYFGLMKGDVSRNNPIQEFSETSKTLKRIAKRYEATIILLAQLNREVDEYAKPSMGMLRDTGSLEQDADKIIFLWRDKDDREIVNFAVAKNRAGITGDGKLRFIGRTMRFEELSLGGVVGDILEGE